MIPSIVKELNAQPTLITDGTFFIINEDNNTVFKYIFFTCNFNPGVNIF